MISKFRNKIGQKRAEKVGARILPFLKDSRNIVDVGCGTCHIAALLQKKGKGVTAVDITNKSLVSGIEVLVYDGKSLPFPDKHFDTSLLLTVLHHTPDSEVVFSEAARVGKELVVIETLHESLLGKLFIVLFDSLINRQLRFHWNSYKTDGEWKKFFKDRSFDIVTTQYHHDKVFGIPYLHGVYYLEKRLTVNRIKRKRERNRAFAHRRKVPQSRTLR